QPSDGAAGAGRLHGSGRGAGDHERALRRPGRQQVPAMPAAGEIRRGRLAGTQVGARLLRLFRRDAGAHPMIRPKLPPLERPEDFPGQTRVVWAREPHRIVLAALLGALWPPLVLTLAIWRPKNWV